MPNTTSFIESHKKNLTSLGGLIAAVASLVTIASYFSDGANTPRFSGDLAVVGYARKFGEFLKENDGKEVYLDIECNDTGYEAGGPGIDPKSRCSVHGEENGANKYMFVLSVGEETVKEYWESSPDTIQTPPIWFSLYTPQNTLSRHSNSSRGAGYSRTQGYFFILNTTSGMVPPEAVYYELTGVDHDST